MLKATAQKPQKQRKVVTKRNVTSKVSKLTKKSKSKTIATTTRTLSTSTPIPKSISKFTSSISSIQQSPSITSPLSTYSMTNKFSQQLSTKLTPLHTIKRFGGGWGYSHYTPAPEIEERILNIIKTLPAVEGKVITNKSHFQKDLGLDSLQQVELMFMLEQHFSVEINDDDAVHIQSVPEAVHYFSHTPYTV